MDAPRYRATPRFQVPDYDGHTHMFELLHPREDTAEVWEWCEDHFGLRSDRRSNSRWWPSSHPGDNGLPVLWRVWLRDEDDAFEFRMRWC